MSVHLSEKEWNRRYTEYFAKYKTAGLSDRDADIMATTGISPRTHYTLADRHGLTPGEVSKIVHSITKMLGNRDRQE